MTSQNYSPDTIVIEELKRDVTVQLSLLNKYTPNPADKEERVTTIRYLLGVLEFYMPSIEFAKYYETIKPVVEYYLPTKKPSVWAGDIEIESVEDQADGSAIVTMNVDEKTKELLVGEGFNFLMIKSILSANTSEMLEWAERGKN